MDFSRARALSSKDMSDFIRAKMVAMMGSKLTEKTEVGLWMIRYQNASLKVLAGKNEMFLNGCWNHVSVSLPDRTPSWEEMDYVKRLFWDDEVTVMQLHVPRSDWINIHPNCLHLWEPVGRKIERPLD